MKRISPKRNSSSTSSSVSGDEMDTNSLQNNHNNYQHGQRRSSFRLSYTLITFIVIGVMTQLYVSFLSQTTSVLELEHDRNNEQQQESRRNNNYYYRQQYSNNNNNAKLDLATQLLYEQLLSSRDSTNIPPSLLRRQKQQQQQKEQYKKEPRENPYELRPLITKKRTTPRKKRRTSREESSTNESFTTTKTVQHPNSWLSRRIVWLDDPDQTLELITASATKSITQGRRTVDILGTGSCPYCEQEPYNYMSHLERQYQTECQPVHEWQTQQFPTCNVIHEIFSSDENDDTVSLLSTDGSWRDVWKVSNNNNHNHNHNNEHLPAAAAVVLKTLQIHHRNFTHESYEYHRVDALAMERLTSSRFVVNVYGFCGQSVVTEFATGSAREFVKQHNNFTSPLDRLKLARDLAQALTDVHSIGCDKLKNTNTPNSKSESSASCLPSLVHNDMNMANVVEVNGTIKLNDFNIAMLLRKNKTKTTTSEVICQTPVRFESKLWKSPEEIANITGSVNATPTDVYGLGNLLFQVLTKRQPWTHMEPNGALEKDQVAERKIKGILPHVKEKYTARGTKEMAIKALYHAVMACFRFDPNQRPTAQELTTKLEIAIQWIEMAQQKTKKLNKKIEIEDEMFERLFQNEKNQTNTINQQH